MKTGWSECFYRKATRWNLAAAGGYKKLKGRDAYRIRIANYRAIYEINDHILLVNVVEVGHRKEVYE